MNAASNFAVLLGRYPQLPNEWLVHHSHPAFADRPDAEFGLPGTTELPNDEHIERGMESGGHLRPDGYTTARQPQHHHVPRSEPGKRLRQPFSGLVPVDEHPPPLSAPHAGLVQIG
jgi:hypothetical protein